jgi:hypothetical protein
MRRDLEGCEGAEDRRNEKAKRCETHGFEGYQQVEDLLRGTEQEKERPRF